MASDIATDTCRTGLFDLTDPFTLCRDTIAGPSLTAAEPFCHNIDYKHICMMLRIVRNHVLKQAMTTVTNSIGSMQDKMAKDSKEAAAMYRYMCKDRYMYKYIRT